MQIDTAGLYIVVIRDADMWVEGPFASEVDMRAAGEAAQAAGGDDPRWQSVSLPDGFTLGIREPAR